MAKNQFRVSTIQFVNPDFNIVLEKTSDGKQTVHTDEKKIPLEVIKILSEAQEKIINHLKSGG